MKHALLGRLERSACIIARVKMAGFANRYMEGVIARPGSEGPTVSICVQVNNNYPIISGICNLPFFRHGKNTLDFGGKVVGHYNIAH